MASVRMFVSDSNKLLSESNNFSVYTAKELDRSSGLIVEIQRNSKRHTVVGFGAALSGSSCYNLYKMNSDVREKAMASFFTESEGIGLNITRQAIGVTDFAYEYYTYDDIPEGETDFELKHFSIEKDKEYIIPQIKKAKELNPDLIVCGSIWSPPLWMKSLYEWDTVNAAVLRPECYDVYARYLVKCIRAYEAEGIHFDFLTPQNEPFGKHPIPACYYDRDTMADLVINHIVPTFKKEGITTKVFAYDFNLWTDTAIDFINPQSEYVDGIAMHYYGTEFKSVRNVHNAFPKLPLYITECGSPYERRYDSMIDPILSTVGDITSALNYGANAYIRWNYVLDDKGGPSDPRNGNDVCEGIITYHPNTKTTTFGSGYYGIGHFSKFVRPGAKVLECTDLNEDESRKYYAFAAENTDGSVATVIANTTEDPKTYELILDDTVVECTLNGKSVATIVLK